MVKHTISVSDRLRQFNRFYTQRLGLLNASHLQAPFSLPEVRVLYELAHRQQPTASEIAGALGMDEGYLSRLLGKLRQLGLVRARPAASDGRQRWLRLTSKGEKAFRTLDARATVSIEDLIRHLSSTDRKQLVDAITTVESLLTDTQYTSKCIPADRVEIRAPEPGDLGWVIQRHGEIYHREYGWDLDFERLVAQIVAEYAVNGEGSSRRCWIATLGGRRAGCVFLMPGDESRVGRLRLLLVEPWARGHSIGTLLVNECIQASRKARQIRLTLWTNDVLHSARRIYERAGFKLVHSERHQSFGKSLVGQNWDLVL